MENTGETILGRLAHWAEKTPDKICLIEPATDKKITYGEFWEKILKRAASIESGKLLILKTAQTIEHLVNFYAIQAAGSVAIPAEFASTEERLRELAALFDAEVMPLAEGGGGKKTSFTEPDPEDVACVIISSGTTGKPKGVMSSFRCRFSGADNVRAAYDITPEDRALVPQMLSHSGGLRRVEAMLVAGAGAVIMNPTMFFGNVFGALSKYQCNILQLVPAQVSQILSRAEKMLVKARPSLRILSVGSAVIGEHDKERLRKILPGVRLFNDFGSTEAVGSAYFEWSAYPPKPDCVGKVGLHAHIVFLDEEGNILANTDRDNPGILATEGGVIMSGYLRAPELTAKVMVDNRIVSSDFGYMGQDGMIYVMGRRDDMIISGGNKISPREVEDAAMDIPGVKECALVAVPDKIMGEIPVLFVVWENEGLPPGEVAKFLETRLEHFKVPREEHICNLDKLPRTPGTGKIIKIELKERWLKSENI